MFQSKYIMHKGTMKIISEGNLNRVGAKKNKNMLHILIHT